MRHPLSVTWIGVTPEGIKCWSDVETVMTEMDVSPPPYFIFPDSLDGQLVDVNPELVQQLKFGESVSIAFGGRRYKFNRLESDGRFQLGKAWYS